MYHVYTNVRMMKILIIILRVSFVFLRVYFVVTFLRMGSAFEFLSLGSRHRICSKASTVTLAASSWDFVDMFQRVLLDVTVKPISPASRTYTTPSSADLATCPLEPLVSVRTESVLFTLNTNKNRIWECWALFTILQPSFNCHTSTWHTGIRRYRSLAACAVPWFCRWRDVNRTLMYRLLVSR